METKKESVKLNHFTAIYFTCEGKILLLDLERDRNVYSVPVLTNLKKTEDVDSYYYSILDYLNNIFNLDSKEIKIYLGKRKYTFKPLINMNFNIVICHLNHLCRSIIGERFKEFNINEISLNRDKNIFCDIICNEYKHLADNLK